MENTEMQNNQMTEKPELALTKESIEYLTETRKWTMFFSILGFISIGIMLIAALVMGIIGIVGLGFGGHRESMIFGVLTIVYLIIGGVYFFPILYLLKFSTNMKTAIEQTKQNNLVRALENLKSHYRFVGIITIALFGLYILIGMIVAIVGIGSLL